MRPALAILLKDLRLRVRDRSVLLFAVVVPLGLTLLFSTMFPDLDELQVAATVIDEDGGEVAAGFTHEVVPALVEDGVVLLSEFPDLEGARAALRAGELDAAWVIPEGFSDGVSAGSGGEIEVLVNPDRVLSGEVARAVADAYATRLTAVALAVATVGVGAGGDPSAAQVEQAIELATAAVPAVTLTGLDTADRQLDIVSYLAAGMAAFFVFFTVQYGVTGMLEERSLGTLPRLLAAPIPPWATQVGKVLGAAVLGLVSLSVLAVASALVLGADWGPPGGTAILIVALVIAAVGLMALVGSFAQTAEQAGNAQSIVAIVLGMAGGVFFPIPGESLLLRLASASSPHAWFLRGLGDASGTGEWTAALPAAGAIAAFGVAAALPAAWILRRRHRW